MHQGRLLLGATIAMLLLAGPASAGSAADVDSPDDDWLWLAAPEQLKPLPNFTADPPQDAGPLAVPPAPIQTGSNQIIWKWIMPRVPTEWRVPQDTTFTTELVFTGLERVLPLADVEAEPTQIGRMEVRVDILRIASDEGIATGATYLSPRPLAGPDTQAVSVDATAHKAVTYGTEPGDAPLFGLKVTLTGLARNDDPPMLLVAHPDHPARLLAPGFPIAALRDWSALNEADARCNERVLQQMDCDDDPAARPLAPQTGPTVVDGTSQAEEAHGLGVVAIAGLLAMIAVAMRNRRGTYRD